MGECLSKQTVTIESDEKEVIEMKKSSSQVCDSQTTESNTEQNTGNHKVNANAKQNEGIPQSDQSFDHNTYMNHFLLQNKVENTINNDERGNQDQDFLQFYEMSKLSFIRSNVYCRQTEIKSPDIKENITTYLSDYSYGNIRVTDGNYNGDLYQQTPHGDGTLIFDNGNKYVGHFEHGNPQGKGEFTFNDSQDTYKGEFLDGKFSGEGTLTSGKGLWEYKGQFKNGMRHGEGIFSTKTKIFRGQFIENKYSNFGVIESLERDEIYNGYHQNFLEHGFGCLKTKSGKIIYDGEWNLGKMVNKKTKQ